MTRPISFDLSGKTLVVTGAGRGIGRAIARVAADFGANLALGSRRVEECAEVAALCREKGSRAKAWELDVAEEESVERFVEQAWTELDGVWCLVNNADL